MKTRAQERAASLDPSPPKDQSSQRKRRATSPINTDDASPYGASQTAAQRPSLKKRKKTVSSVITTTTDQHPVLNTVEEEEIVTKETIPEGGIATADVLGHDRRASLPPSAFGGGHQDKIKGRRSRNSLPLGDAPSFEDGTLVSLRQLVQQRLKERSRGATTGQSATKPSPKADRDMLVYDTTSGLPRTTQFSPPSSQHDSHVFDTSPAHALTIVAKSEQERLAFDETIERLTRETAEAKAGLEILMVELRSMGFAADGSSPISMVTSIRSSFQDIRNRLQSVMPIQASDEVLESVLLANITDTLLELSHANNTQAQELHHKQIFEHDLLLQIEGLVDKLADAELIRSQLSTARSQLKTDSKEDARYIKKMEAKLTEIEKQHLHVTELLRQTAAELQTTRNDKKSLAKDCDKLKTAIADYRATEARLSDLITRMEHDHATTLAQHQTDAQAKQAQLNETLKHERAQRISLNDKLAIASDTIAVLEQAKTDHESSIEDMSKQLHDAAQSLAHERGVTAGKSEEIVEKSEHIDNLQAQLGATEQALDDMDARLADIRRLADNQGRQRVAAETALDETRGDLSKVNEKLHKQGIEANQLRQKLFEAQQNAEKTARDLNATMSQQREQFENDLENEARSREDAQLLADERQTLINDLEAQLADVQATMRKRIKEKEKLLHDMEERALYLQDELDAAGRLIDQQKQDQLDMERDAAAQITFLQDSNKQLDHSLADKSSTIIKIKHQAAEQQQLMTDTLAERDAVITSLKDTVSAHNKRINVLEADKTSLERRVEAEAEAMLSYQDEKAREILALKSAISQVQSDLANATQKATQEELKYSATLHDKSTELTSLTTTLAYRDASLAQLKIKNADLADTLKTFVAKASAVTAGLTEELALAKTRADAERTGLDDAAGLVLGRIKELEWTEADEATAGAGQGVVVDGVMEQAPQVQVQQQEKKKVKKSRGFWRDSGVAIE